MHHVPPLDRAPPGAAAVGAAEVPHADGADGADGGDGSTADLVAGVLPAHTHDTLRKLTAPHPFPLHPAPAHAPEHDRQRAEMRSLRSLERLVGEYRSEIARLQRENKQVGEGRAGRARTGGSGGKGRLTRGGARRSAGGERWPSAATARWWRRTSA